jgi:transposase InsO family protein
MSKGGLWKDATVRHRLQVGGYARICGNISATARHFAHDRKTVRDYLRRYEEFEKTGDLAIFLNQARGDSHRTEAWIEQQVVSYYQEEDTQRSCPNIAHTLEQEQRVKLSRQTVYNILQRQQVWQPPLYGPLIRRFEKTTPNALWQVDLIEQETTCLGPVYALVAIDDHSRFLTALRFSFSKDQEAMLYALYMAFAEYGLPAKLLVDRGGQFYTAVGEGESRFLAVMQTLGIAVEYTSRPQTKGKVEKVIQFVERDFLNVQRNRLQNLDDLNAKAAGWRDWYNQRAHESILTEPNRRYKASAHRLASETLWNAFAREDRKKVYRDGTIRLWGVHYPLPKEYAGGHAWVRTFYDQAKVVIGPDDEIIATYSCSP